MGDIEKCKKLLGILKHIAENGPVVRDRGICCAIAAEAEYKKGYNSGAIFLRTLFAQIAETWPEFSGRVAYPVTVEGFNPEYLYDNYFVNGLDMWNDETEYGAARLRLLHFTINELEKTVSKHETK